MLQRRQIQVDTEIRWIGVARLESLLPDGGRISHAGDSIWRSDRIADLPGQPAKGTTDVFVASAAVRSIMSDERRDSGRRPT